MEKKIALFAAALVIAFVSNPAVLALSPMGPPKALLGQDLWDVCIEYSNQTMDLEASGTETNTQHLLVFSGKSKYNIKDLKSNIIMARGDYGINNNWDAFVRLGIADAKCDFEQIFTNADPYQYRGFDGSFGFAWGFGTRATFWQDDEVSWGGLFQMTWIEPDDSGINSIMGNLNYSGTAEVEIREVQIALGPTWRVDDSIRIYGGPFLHYVNGDLDMSGEIVNPGVDFDIEFSGDIEESSQFGGYAGAHLNVDENTSCYIEYQLTGDAWAIGLGAARKF